MPPITETYIHPTAVMGLPLRPLQGMVTSSWRSDEPDVRLGHPVYIGPFVTIGEAVTLGDRVIVDERCSIGRGSRIGDDTLLIYAANVGGHAEIGRNCVIGNVVSERAVIGDRCRVFGRVIHKHENSTISWDHHEIPEPSVSIHDDSFVGFDAIVAGGLKIGPRAYVCAGAVVTRSVPPLHIAYGVNKTKHHSEWVGDLARNPLFRE
jgi:UDP-3-O-[3-hydroxymyristoyl] glucosamine N-acyltransferase